MERFNLLKKFEMFLLTAFVGVLTFAQDAAPDLKVDVKTDNGMGMGDGWMTNPLVWVIGALVLILIIALVARGGGNRS